MRPRRSTDPRTGGCSDAQTSLLAAERGDLAVAREARADAAESMRRLDLGPESEAAYWLGGADRAIARSEGALLSFTRKQHQQ
jgi:hypothetical protein